MSANTAADAQSVLQENGGDPVIKMIGKVKLDYRNYSDKNSYSDCVIEDELLDLVQNYNEQDYSPIIRARKNWTVLYHLSHCRQNILEWIPFQKTDHILEIGAECGAVTGCLADKAAQVTCIELSEKKSLINAYRNQNRQNIDILLGRLEDVEQSLEERYDYIVMIGVLGTASLHVSGELPYINFLKICKKHLNPGGKVIIAIENKLGMKYWAGCREDHSGLYFESIEGYSCTTGAQTFSRLELEELLKKAELPEMTFYYPYPDYKLPLAIYSDDYLPNPADLNKNVLNLDRDRLLLFDEAKAFDSVIKAGAFSVFANSYLIIAGSEDAK